MKPLIVFFFSALVSMYASVASAYDPQLEEALQKTKDLMTNPSARSEAIKSNQAAYDADLNARNLMGSPEGVEQLYGLSADIMQQLVRKAQGSPNKLQQLIAEALANPKQFLQSLGPKERQKVKELADQIEGRSPASDSKR